ncbi:LOW QUALITY PROTEIN: FBD domain-containing protein, partial [Cephalotus follicularis]
IHHKLPSSLFSCLKLKHLSLASSIFTPPPPATFTGFCGLISLKLENVTIGADFFHNLISKSPLLEELNLQYCINIDILEIGAPNLKSLYFEGPLKSIGLKNTPLLSTVMIVKTDEPASFNGGQTCNMTKVFCGLRVVECLCLNNGILKYLAEDSIPEMLPSTLDHLKRLELYDLNLGIKAQVSCALCLIRSSPNLQKLEITVSFHEQVIMLCILKIRIEFLDCPSRDGCLNRLRLALLTPFNGTIHELELVKFLLANSSVLEIMHIETPADMAPEVHSKILRKIVRFPRASTKAEIFYED